MPQPNNNRTFYANAVYVVVAKHRFANVPTGRRHIMTHAERCEHKTHNTYSHTWSREQRRRCGLVWRDVIMWSMRDFVFLGTEHIHGRVFDGIHICCPLYVFSVTARARVNMRAKPISNSIRRERMIYCMFGIGSSEELRNHRRRVCVSQWRRPSKCSRHDCSTMRNCGRKFHISLSWQQHKII